MGSAGSQSWWTWSRVTVLQGAGQNMASVGTCPYRRGLERRREEVGVA